MKSKNYPVLDWQHRLLEYGWFSILRPRVRDFIHFCIRFSYKDCVPIDVSSVRELLGMNKTTLIDAISELESYGIISRPPQETVDVVNKYLEEKNVRTGDLLLRLKSPPKLSREESWLLNDAKIRDGVLSLVGKGEVSTKLLKTIEQRCKSIEKSPMETDVLRLGVYNRLIVLMKKKIKEPRTDIPLKKLLAFLLPQEGEEAEMLNRKLYPEKMKRASNEHWRSLNKFERDVAMYYEKFTGNELKADEADLVKECVRLCYPAQLKWAIQQHSDKMKDFSYLVALARRGACGRRSDSKSGGAKGGERAVGQAFEADQWSERRQRFLKRRAASNGS